MNTIQVIATSLITVGAALLGYIKYIRPQSSEDFGALTYGMIGVVFIMISLIMFSGSWIYGVLA